MATNYNKPKYWWDTKTPSRQAPYEERANINWQGDTSNYPQNSYTSPEVAANRQTPQAVGGGDNWMYNNTRSIENYENAPSNSFGGATTQEVPQQKMSNWDAFSKGAQGVSALGNAYIGWETLKETKKQNELAKDTANTNVATQSAMLAQDMWQKTYRNAVSQGASREDAAAAANNRVNQTGLPTNIKGDNLNINWS